MDDYDLTPPKNPPLNIPKNPPLGAITQRYDGGKRRYTAAQKISDLALRKFRKNGRGITCADLIVERMAKHKRQAQETLKYCIQREILFTLKRCRPQQYFATEIRSEVLAKVPKNPPIDPTGVNYFSTSLNSNANGSSVVPTLEGTVLSLLPSAPLFIHNIHLKLKIPSERYAELNLPISKGNSVFFVVSHTIV
jgi:hypothetical protein